MVLKKRVAQIVGSLSTLVLSGCTSTDIGSFPSFEEIFNRILTIGTLGFLGDPNKAVGFMRIMVFILVLALFYEGARFVFRQPEQRHIRLVIALVLAIISSIFMPASVLAGVGIAYGTIVAFFLIGIPVFAGLFAIYVIPSTNPWLMLLKIGILSLLLVILIEVRDHALAGFAL